MYIRVSEIPREGLDVVQRRGKAWVPRLLDGMDPYPLETCRMLSATLFLSMEGRDLETSGSFVAEGESACDRCSETVIVRMEKEFRTVFVPRDRRPPETGDLELSPGDLDIAFYDGAGIEVSDIFWEQVALALPAKILCREDCLGVCPACGANRNRTTCDCAAEARRGAFDVLKSLKIREKE